MRQEGSEILRQAQDDKNQAVDRSCLRADAQHLAAFVITARSASGVRLDRAPALRAFVEQRGLPAMRSLAGAQAHLRCFTFGDSHKKGSMKAGISEKTTATASTYPARSNPAAVSRPRR